jgi:hypothetical protein
MTRVGAMAVVGQIWWNFNTTSCAAAIPGRVAATIQSKDKRK